MSNDIINNHPPESDTSSQLNHGSLYGIITLILLVFFSIGFSSIYFSRIIIEYFTGGRAGLPRRSPAPNAVGHTARGLNPSIVSSFPTFVYSTVKNLRQDQSSLECAVCLSGFEDDDVLRLLTLCNHIFHIECINLWLELHSTCPVCQRNLDPLEKSSEKSQEINLTIVNSIEGENEVRNDIERVRDVDVPNDTRAILGGHRTMERFSRSHSTGHSIVKGDDRFTLRLPDHAKERITRGHNFTGSCITFGDF